MTPTLARAIERALAPLREQGLGPDGVELDWRTVTLLYADALTEKVVAGGGLAPDPILVDQARYVFTTRVQVVAR